MKPTDVLEILNREIEKICSSLPEHGRRLVILEYILPEEMFEALLENLEFKAEVERGNPNLGGIPVRLGSDLEIRYYQAPKQRKYFRMEKKRGKLLVTKEEMESESF